MQEAELRCILCGSSERKPLFTQREWSVWRCAQCGLGLLDPLPDEDELSLLYDKEYFKDQYDAGIQPGTPEMKKRLSHETHRIRFIKGAKRKGSILDIGCGMGYFLNACRNSGYTVEGMDISDDASSYVRDVLGIKVKTGPLDKVDFAENSFDVITMWHFLEHARDPREYLKCAWEWLRPGGVLVVDVPNYVGTDARKTWHEWKGWQLPFHLYHFTPNALCRMLSEHGFTPVRKKDYLSEYVKERLENITGFRPLARMVAQCFSGHSFAVVARKKE